MISYSQVSWVYAVPVFLHGTRFPTQKPSIVGARCRQPGGRNSVAGRGRAGGASLQVAGRDGWAGAAPLQVAGRISSSPPWGSQLLQEARGTRQGAVPYSPCRRGSSLPLRVRLLVAGEVETGRRPRAGHAVCGGGSQRRKGLRLRRQ
jgi:hypothetical protein